MIALSVRERLRLIAVIAMFVLAFGAAACGSDDGDKDDGDAAAVRDPAASGDATSAGSPDEQEIRALFAKMRQAFAKSDARTVCDNMARAPKLRVVQTDPTGGTCETIFAKLFDSGGVTEDLDPKLAGVDVNGDKAIVTARSSKRIARARFAKEDGEWKVALWLTD